MISAKKMKMILDDVQDVVSEARSFYKINKWRSDSYEYLIKGMKEIGWDFLGQGWGKTVFHSKENKEIVIKIALFNPEEGAKEVEVFNEISESKSKKFRDMFVSILGYSKKMDIIICEKLTSIEWNETSFKKVYEKFENMLEKHGFMELVNDLSEENILCRVKNGKRFSVLCDLGYCGKIRPIKSRVRKVKC